MKFLHWFAKCKECGNEFNLRGEHEEREICYECEAKAFRNKRMLEIRHFVGAEVVDVLPDDFDEIWILIRVRSGATFRIYAVPEEFELTDWTNMRESTLGV